MGKIQMYCANCDNSDTIVVRDVKFLDHKIVVSMLECTNCGEVDELVNTIETELNEKMS